MFRCFKKREKVSIIVSLRTPSNELLKDFNEPVQWKIKKYKNIAEVHADVVEDPKKFFSRRLRQLDLREITTWDILENDLGLRAYGALKTP